METENTFIVVNEFGAKLFLAKIDHAIEIEEVVGGSTIFLNDIKSSALALFNMSIDRVEEGQKDGI